MLIVNDKNVSRLLLALSLVLIGVNGMPMNQDRSNDFSIDDNEVAEIQRQIDYFDEKIKELDQLRFPSSGLTDVRGSDDGTNDDGDDDFPEEDDRDKNDEQEELTLMQVAEILHEMRDSGDETRRHAIDSRRTRAEPIPATIPAQKTSEDPMAISNPELFLKRLLKKKRSNALRRYKELGKNEGERLRRTELSAAFEELAAVVRENQQKMSQVAAGKAAIQFLSKYSGKESSISEVSGRDFHKALKSLYDEIANQLPGKFIMATSPNSLGIDTLTRIEVIYLATEWIKQLKATSANAQKNEIPIGNKSAIASEADNVSGSLFTGENVMHPDQIPDASAEALMAENDLKSFLKMEREKLKKDSLDLPKHELLKLFRSEFADAFSQLASVLTVEPESYSQADRAKAAILTVSSLSGEPCLDLKSIRVKGESKSIQIYNTLKVLLAEMARLLPGGSFKLIEAGQQRSDEILTRIEVLILTKRWIEILLRSTKMGKAMEPVQHAEEMPMGLLSDQIDLDDPNLINMFEPHQSSHHQYESNFDSFPML